MKKVDMADGQSEDIVDQNIQRMKELFPDVFSEGGVNFDVLRQILGDAGVVDEGEEKYGLNWHGKKKARQIALTPSLGTLLPCPEESVDWDNTQNIFIEGDNLEVLKLLQKSYANKVKMIYIDPPYNTGKEFIYPDRFQENLDTYLRYTGQVDDEGVKFSSNTEATGRKHTNWLSMMLPRLKLARNLLSDDGVIFISIDDNEQADLKKLCDEVFGGEQFVANLSVENNPKGRKNSRYISVSNDYCLIYAKNKEKSRFVENIPKNIADMKQDEDGNYVHASGKRVLVGENDFNSEVKSFSSEKHYSVYFRVEDKDMILKSEKDINEKDSDLISAGYVRYVSFSGEKFVENTYTKSKIVELYDSGALEFTDNKIFEKNFNSSIRMKSLLTNRSYQALVNGQKMDYKLDVKTTSAGTLLKSIFDTKEPIFSSPKSVGLLELLITLFEEKDFIILDFFCGSATAAHAAMKVNSSDGGSRRYIMTQLPEPCDETTEAYKLGYKTIADIAKDRIKLASKDLCKDGVANSFDSGFKVFKLSSSSVQVWSPDRENIEDSLLSSQNSLVEGRDEKDILYELLLKRGVDLAAPIESRIIGGKNIFSIGYGVLFACLDSSMVKDELECVAEAIIQWHGELSPSADTHVFFRDSAFEDDISKTNMVAILEQNGIAHVRSL